MKSIKKQFLFDLMDIYDAENRIARALPKMIKEDTSPELKIAIQSHAEEIQRHVTKVAEIFECFGHAADGFSGIFIDECADECVTGFSEAAALIAGLQDVEPHHVSAFYGQREWELASYGCLQEWASLLGSSESADLLEQIVAEEAQQAAAADERHRIDRIAM